MSLFHFNIPISTNGVFQNPISTKSSITSSNISRSIPNTQSLHTRITTTSTTIPITPTIAEIRHQRSKYALERTFQVWGKSKLACSYVQANHASSAKFLRSPALSTGQAIGASLLSLARCGGLWDYPRALKAGLLHPTATNLYQLGSPSLCILCHAHLDCKPMAHLVVDCTHPTVFFCSCRHTAAAGNQRHACANFLIAHCTPPPPLPPPLPTPASPSFSTTSSNSSTYTIGTSAIWDSVNTHTPIDNHQYSPRPTSQSSPSSPSSPSDFSIFSFSHFSPHTRFEPPISVAHSEIPRQAQDTVEENPTASRTTTTDTHTAAISSTPTPTHISYIGSDDILTVLLGGSLPGTNTAGNTEACPGQQWLTDKMPFPVRVRKLKLKSYGENCDAEQYNAFIAICSKKQSVEQCISPRQLNLFLPYELMLQTYLSRPGYDNPYVPMTFDHYILADAFILVMEYFEDCYSAHPFAHLVVECEQVVGHRIQSGLVPAIQKSRLRPLGRALDPGVENVYTWLRGGVLNGEADLDQQWLDGTVEHESMGTRHDNRALAARLADFLHVAYRQYQSTLWQIPPGSPCGSWLD
ncbi:hypothetical protein BASA60_000762 [Batrachochytrium salamandrivorans]|nr:hypothetical protein BASA60_000762 [Batrachochytrium salamandrivorans]